MGPCVNGSDGSTPCCNGSGPCVNGSGGGNPWVNSSGGGGFACGAADPALGNMTGRVRASLASCSPDAPLLSGGSFFLSIFKNATGHYNLHYTVVIRNVTSASSVPDTITLVKSSTACNNSAPTLFSFPVAADEWELANSTGGPARWGLYTTVTVARLFDTLEDVDAATIEDILAGVPNATVPEDWANGVRGWGQGVGKRVGQRGRALWEAADAWFKSLFAVKSVDEGSEEERGEQREEEREEGIVDSEEWSGPVLGVFLYYDN
ncbi:unnamed protein product [Closterium sp. NIES-64]|nr:unnamed protein product [Closterium sp. NIES-64]